MEKREICDHCGKLISIPLTAMRKIEKDGLIPVCKDCQKKIGIKKTKFKGQIQTGYYLSNN